MYNAQCIQKAGASLGESPVWDPEGKQLYWVDINNRHINRLDPKTGDTFRWPCHTEIGCIGLAKQGKLIAGLRDGFHYFNPSNGVFDLIVDPEPDKPINRLNDGKVDRAGRMWSGSMQDPNPDQPSGALYRLDSSCRMLRRCASSGRRPKPASMFSIMWSGLVVSVSTQVTARFERMYFNENCAQV